MKDKKVLLFFGLIGGAITVINFFVFGAMWQADPDNPNWKLGEVIGYATFILALSTVFFGVRAYRDKQRNGFISFKDAFLNGMIIVLIASVIYVVGWMFYYPNFMPDFVDQYRAQQIALVQDSGLPAEETSQKIAEINQQMDTYSHPLVMAGFTFLEIFPVGLIIALITAFILKRKTAAP